MAVWQQGGGWPCCDSVRVAPALADVVWVVPDVFAREHVMCLCAWQLAQPGGHHAELNDRGVGMGVSVCLPPPTCCLIAPGCVARARRGMVHACRTAACTVCSVHPACSCKDCTCDGLPPEHRGTGATQGMGRHR